MTCKSSAGKLYQLLSLCDINENSIEIIDRKLCIEQIFSDKTYIFLTDPESKHVYFETLLSKENIINNLSLNELNSLKKALPFIPQCIYKIKNSIEYGNGFTLQSSDMPNFMSEESMMCLINKLDMSDPSINFTNINSYDFLDIFSDDTIKEADEILNVSDLNQIDNINEILEKAYEGKKYCISGNSIFLRKRILLEIMANQEAEKLLKQIRHRSRKRLKTFLILLAFLIFAASIVIIFVN